MRLIKLWDGDLNKAYQLHQEIGLDENGFSNSANGIDLKAFREYVYDKKYRETGERLPNGFVPDTTYVLENDDGEYVGVFNLRHYLNKFLENGPGHIGYAISNKYRKMGYGTKGLALTLIEAKKLGIDVAYMSCYKDNIGSLKVQLNNGAYIDREDDFSYYTKVKL